jgi:hypothetical protein
MGLGHLGLALSSICLMTSGALAEAEPMIAPLAKLASELRSIVAAFWTQPKVFDAIVSQAESLPRSAAQVAATGDYDDVPSVVLPASNSSPSQMALARLSFHGKHIVNADEPLAQHGCQI